MKIAVVCSNGRTGQLIVKELLDRNVDVTAIARGENKSAATQFVSKDLFDLTREDVAGFDVVIDAFGAWAEEDLPKHVTSSQHVCDLLSGTDTRLLIVGGAGSLYTNPEHTAVVMDGPDFPDAFKPLAGAQGQELAKLRERDDVKWTFVSPAADFQADGPRTGAYELHGEEFAPNSKGESVIGYADYAIGMVDEALSGNHIQQRISLVRA